MTRYWLLLERDKPGSKWHVQFGDYDHAVVKQERDDRADSWPYPARHNMRVYAINDADSVTANAALAALNMLAE